MVSTWVIATFTNFLGHPSMDQPQVRMKSIHHVHPPVTRMLLPTKYGKYIHLHLVDLGW